MEPRHECPTSDGPHRHSIQYNGKHAEKRTSETQRQQTRHMTR